MRKNKTSQRQRKFYRYYQANGSYEEITSSEEVSAHLIHLLHEMDDEEFDAERRENYHVPLHYQTLLELNVEVSFLESSILIDEAPSPLDVLLEVESESEKAELWRRLHEAIGTLTPKQQKTIAKIFYQGMTQTELAREERIANMTVSNRLTGAFKKLRKELKNFQKIP